MIFSKTITGAVIGAFAGLLIFACVPAHGAAGISSALGLGLEVIGISKTPAGSFVILQDSATGRRGVYKAGGVVKGAKIVEVNREDVVFEREGATEAIPLRKSAAMRQGTAPVPGGTVASPEAFPGASGPGDDSFSFDPVTSAAGPAVDGGEAPELPYFEPITNDTGPVAPIGEGYEPKELPEFVPVENMTGPIAE